MTTCRIHFLSGLPRTGSTLLGSVLNQNPSIFATPTSPLYALLSETNDTLNLLGLQYTFDEKRIADSVYRDVIKSFYPNDREFPIVFDKHRGWPKRVDAIREFIDPDPKVICTVRPIAEIIASYITLADKDADNFIDNHLKRDGVEVTNEARAMLLWTEYLRTPYECMTVGMKLHPDSLLLVEYDDLVFDTTKTLERVYGFCGLEPYEHDTSHIKNTCAEAKDEAWGMKGLHDIRPKLKRMSVNPLAYLPQSAVDYFTQFDLGATWH